MNTFTKTLIASAMAVAVAGTASADPKFAGVYSGGKTKMDITPCGCPNAKAKNVTTVVSFAPGIFEWFNVGLDKFEVNIPFAGCWEMSGLAGLIDPDLDDRLVGSYIERKPGKDLTMATTLFSLDEIVDAMNYHLVTESKCDVALIGVGADLKGVDPLSVTLKKGNGKLSKNGERVKVDIQIDATYDNDSDKNKKIKAKINGKMDFAAGVNAFDGCDAIVDFTPCEELNEVCAQ